MIQIFLFETTEEYYKLKDQLYFLYFSINRKIYQSRIRKFDVFFLSRWKHFHAYVAVLCNN